MINLLICFPIASTQEINQTGWQDMITWSQWFRDFIHLCCTSSSYRLVISLVQSNPMGHMLDVGNELHVLSHHLVGQLYMYGIHRRFTNVPVHQLCKLLQLFHHMSLDVPVVTYLPECFVEPGILFQLFKLPHLSFAFERAGAITFSEDTVAEESDTVDSQRDSTMSDNCMLTISLTIMPIQSSWLCPGTQSTWLNGHDAVESQTCLQICGFWTQRI